MARPFPRRAGMAQNRRHPARRRWRLAMEMPLVVGLGEVGLDDLRLVGGKNASTGEMLRKLAEAGVRVPDGFALTTEAYRCHLRAAGLEKAVGELLGKLVPSDTAAVARAGAELRRRIADAAASAGGRGGRAGGLCPSVGGLRRERNRRGRAQQRDRRGSAERFLRRAARVVPERARLALARADHPRLHGLALHRPRHRLPRRARDPARGGRPLGGRSRRWCAAIWRAPA